MRLYMVRHGETDWNKERRIQGQADIPLNEFGRSLARKTAKGLIHVPFSACYSSPLKRATETAELILDNRKVPVVTDERIIEMSFAEWEGRRCTKESWEVPGRFQLFFDDPEHYEPAAGGEGFAEVKKRTGEFLTWLFAQKEHEGENILIVTHGAALAGMLNHIKGLTLAEYWSTGIHKKCAVTEVEVSGGTAKICSENKVYYDDQTKAWGDV